MARISAALVALCLTTLLLGVAGRSKVVEKRDVQTIAWNDYLQYLCTHGFPGLSPSLCNAYTTTTTTTPAYSGSSTSTSATSSASSSSASTSSASSLQRAHWCQLTNGTYLSLGQLFIYNTCSVCQCGQTHTVRCANLQCMTTYCFDGSTPTTRPGQCCQQCAYENASTSCVVDGVSFPTGTLLRRTTDNIQCWCELGTVECRKSAGSALSSLDYWGDGTAVYVLVIVICVVVFLGTLLCCGGGFFYYYYYYNRQQTFQDAYAQYYSNAGWQPMNDEGQVNGDAAAQEKQAEAEQQQYPAEQTEEYIPPPYALYNGSYVNQQNQKEQPFA